MLLVGPYDPHCGEFTFLAPPLGVWRLAGFLTSLGIAAEVFDPNCCSDAPTEELERTLDQGSWDVVGFSTTGMTLRFDLELAHLARRKCPNALIIAGGMEATFNPDLMFQVGPFDLVVLGEGEKPLLEIVTRLRTGRKLGGIAGTAERSGLGTVNRFPQRALTREELRDSIFKTRYDKMPYRAYWERLERSYRVGELPHKAQREASLGEIRSVRLITLNYCPMGCTFCSSTNFLNEAQNGVAGIARLDADECVQMIRKISSAVPDVRSIIFQDDIFVFTQDPRILPLCEAIIRAKERGDLPKDLQFISTNRIDSMNAERLGAMRRAGFRVLGFGVENFSRNILTEFNKARIFPYIDPILGQALDLGITPFLDLILTSPRCGLRDFAETIRRAYQWLMAGCELGMYPYVIPFSGAVMARDATLAPHTIYATHRVAGTAVEWQQPSKILPIDPTVRRAILSVEQEFEQWMEVLQPVAVHLPSRLRSLVWIVCASRVLSELGEEAPDRGEALEELLTRLPAVNSATLEAIRDFDLTMRNGARVYASV
jgi:radical SAM superfamily enzyme YgiQ (UPF0313 family)